MKSVLKRITRSSAFPAFVLMVAVYVANTFLVKGFTGGAALLSFINLAAPLVCLTIALSVVVIGGGFDVLLGAIVCVVNVTYVTFVDKGVPVFTAALAGIGLAMAVGLLNGVMVGFFRLNPLLTTFATTSVASGLALCIMPTPSGVGNADFIRFYSSGNILGIPTSVWFILVPLIIWFVIRMTPFGVWIYAVGKDEKKAYFSGIPSNLVHFTTYLYAAFCTAIGAIALSGNIGGGNPTVGLSLSMNAVAAVVIGGVALTGGEGNPIGAMFGAMFMYLITYTVYGAKINAYYQGLSTAIIMLAGVLLMSLIKKYKPVIRLPLRKAGDKHEE